MPGFQHHPKSRASALPANDPALRSDEGESSEALAPVRATVRWWAFILAIAWMATAGALLFTTPWISTGPDDDGLGHFVLFGALCIANIAVALSPSATNRVAVIRNVVIAATLTMVLAAGSEIVQHFLPIRSFETSDLAFDVTGISVALIICLFLFLALGRDVLIEMLVGFGITGWLLLIVTLVVLAEQDDTRAVDVACANLLAPPPADSGENHDAGEVRVRFSEPQNGCVAFGEQWLAPLMGSVEWDDDADVIQFESGALRSDPLRATTEEMTASNSFTVGLRFRPTDLYANPVTRWILEILDEDRPGRPLIRILQAGGQIRSDTTVGDRPGDVAMLAVPATLVEDEWTEVLVVVDTEQQQMFVNGVLTGALPRTADRLLLQDDLRLVLGWREISPNTQFRGDMSDVVILPYAIDEADVSTVFEAE